MLTQEKILSGDYTDIEKQRLNKAYKLIATGTKQKGVTKYEIADYIGLSGERTGRDYASAVKLMKPVISHNGFNGFRIAKTDADTQDSIRTVFEVLSRCEAMLYGIIQHFKWLDSQGIEFKKQEQAVSEFLEAMKEKKVAQFKIKE